MPKWKEERLQAACELLEWSSTASGKAQLLPGSEELLLLAHRSFDSHHCEKCADGQPQDSFPDFAEASPLLKNIVRPGAGGYTGSAHQLQPHYLSKGKRKKRPNLFFIIQVLLYWSDPDHEYEFLPIGMDISELPQEALPALRKHPHLIDELRSGSASLSRKGLTEESLRKPYLSVPKFNQRRGRPIDAPRFHVMILLLKRYLTKWISNSAQIVEQLIMLAFPGRYDGHEIRHVLECSAPEIHKECSKFERRFRDLSVRRWQNVLRKEYPLRDWDEMLAILGILAESPDDTELEPLLRETVLEPVFVLRVQEQLELDAERSVKLAKKYGNPRSRCLTDSEIENMSAAERKERKGLETRMKVEQEELMNEFYLRVQAFSCATQELTEGKASSFSKGALPAAKYKAMEIRLRAETETSEKVPVMPEDDYDGEALYCKACGAAHSLEELERRCKEGRCLKCGSQTGFSSPILCF